MQGWLLAAYVPESSSAVSGCVATLKSVPQAEVPGQVNSLFHRKTRGVFQSTVCAVPWG